MSTNDVPGANKNNADELHNGCWAEHEDGSLILVEGVESDRVIYSVFDLSQTPPMEYRDAMPKQDFEDKFSYAPCGSSSIKWTWHDKTQFPWNLVIKEGAKDGLRYACVDDQLSAAAKVAKSRSMHGAPLDPDKGKHLVPSVVDKTPTKNRAVRNIMKALGKLKRSVKSLVGSNNSN
jgi:hypothetical protein